jgi:alginate O-acetyltransferase complex protein AlgI
MTFNSLQFAAFLAAVLVVYHRLGVRGQNRLVVLAGSIVYVTFDWRFLGVVAFAVVLNYTVGRVLEGAENPGRRRLLLATAVTGQIGVLGFFKYANFFSESFAGLLNSLGLQASPFILDVVLPIGISFYSFQTLAYVVAVYRRQLEAESNFVTFSAFVLWFPQMLSGPIERTTSLLQQIQRTRTRPSPALVESGLVLVLQGLVKKVVIADGIAPLVGAVYAAPDAYAWHALLIATAGFAIQAYGDFSGYSDMARGISRLLGVELRRNFEQPFLSRNIQEFWQRWHTSLGWWFLEHVGRPLGGARRGPRWSAFNTMVIFGLIGLWHGAAWTFVVWGLLNGVLVLTWRRRQIPAGQDPDRLRIREAPRIALTFLLFCLGAVFFRADSLSDAVSVLGRIATLEEGLHPLALILIPIMGLAVLLLDLAERNRRVKALEEMGMRTALGGVAKPVEATHESLIRQLRPIPAGVAVGVMITALVVYSGGSPTPFLYFQF